MLFSGIKLLESRVEVHEVEGNLAENGGEIHDFTKMDAKAPISKTGQRGERRVSSPSDLPLERTSSL